MISLYIYVKIVYNYYIISGVARVCAARGSGLGFPPHPHTCCACPKRTMAILKPAQISMKIWKFWITKELEITVLDEETCRNDLWFMQIVWKRFKSLVIWVFTYAVRNLLAANIDIYNIKMSSEKTETKMEEAYLLHYMTNSLLQQ